MTDQRIQGSRNVQIQGVVGSRIQITYDGATRTIPLEPAHVPVAAKLPSPARLVRAHSGVVPYVDGAGLLSDLEAWVDSSTPFAGQVVAGRGGSGKTRLAVELCLQLQKSDWVCGFLSRIADPGMLDALVNAPTARLVVIDYAEARAEQLELLLPLLSGQATDEAPVRALLLVRGGSAQGDWAARLANRVDAVDAVLDECERRYLEDSPLELERRRELFEGAVPALAERLESPPAAAAPPDLGDEVFESPLMVVIAAYLAAHGEAAPATREELLEEVLAHERRYWREGGGDTGASEVLRERMVALATLMNAESERQAAELLRLLPDLDDATAERRGDLARWVRDQYPGPRWWNPLEPDLVGEHLVARCFSDQLDVLRGVISGDAPEEITRPLEVLARAAADHADLKNALRPILDEELERLCGLAVEQAESVQDRALLYGGAVTLAAAINAAISAVPPDPDRLPGAAYLLPARSNLVLNELAITLLTQEVERHLRSLAAKDPDYLPDLAVALNNLSNRLSDTGRHAEALAASKESVDIRRPLAAENPARHAPSLGIALGNLSIHLSHLDRPDDALAVAEESVEVWRSLAATEPKVYGPLLAKGLNNLSILLAHVGRADDALAMIEESVDSYRAEVAADSKTHAPDLAMALNNFSNRLAGAGRSDDALAAIEESVENWRKLAAVNPATYRPDLAGALINLALHLAEVGRPNDARAAIEESVEAWRPLAVANPGAYGIYLKKALENLAKRLDELGRESEAEKALREASQVDI